jgi:hypothetical protein
MKHTKGKWIAKDSVYSTYKRTEIWSERDNEEPIFEIIHKEVNLSECSPNAKLISKAPEMYEALKDLHENAKENTKPDKANSQYTISASQLGAIYSLLQQIES